MNNISVVIFNYASCHGLNDILIYPLTVNFKSSGSGSCTRPWLGFPRFSRLTNTSLWHKINVQLKTKPHAVAVKSIIKMYALPSLCVADDFRCALLILISPQSYKNVHVEPLKKSKFMSPIVVYVCTCPLHVYMNKAKCKVIFDYRALFLNEPLLIQVIVSDIKDKEAAPEGEHKQ